MEDGFSKFVDYCIELAGCTIYDQSISAFTASNAPGKSTENWQSFGGGTDYLCTHVHPLVDGEQ